MSDEDRMNEPLTPWVPVAQVDRSPYGMGWCVVSPTLASALETPHERRFEASVAPSAIGEGSFTRDVPNVGDHALRFLGEDGLVQVGTRVEAGDLLIGRITPRAGAPLSPEEKLLRAIFGEKAGDVRDASIRMPPWDSGVVTSARLEAPQDDEIARAAVVVSWARPLEVGDVLIDDAGNRALVAEIRDLPVGLLWGDGGPRRIAKAAIARDRMHARSIGPYSLITQQPLTSRDAMGGQAVSAAQIAALVAGGLPWAAWELLTLKSDAIRERTLAYEQLVKGEHPGPRPRPAADPASATWFSLFDAFPARGPDRAPGTVPASLEIAERELLALGFATLVDEDPVRGQWLDTAGVRKRSSGRVHKAETLNYRTQVPEPDGLFCQRIFGPVKDYECACGKYRRMKHRGVVCEDCGVEVVQSGVRRERFGHLELPVPIPHPWRLDELGEALGLSADDVRRVALGEADLTDGGRLGPSGEALERMGGRALARALGGGDLLLEALPILPPDLRPLVPLEGGRFAVSDLNDLYRRVINRSNRLSRLFELDAPSVILRNEAAELFAAVAQLFDNDRQPGPSARHEGRVLMGLREVTEHRLRRPVTKVADYSGVAHLVVDATLPDDTCRLPWAMARQLFRPMTYGLLEARGFVTTIKAAKAAVEAGTAEALDALRDVVSVWPVLLVTERGIAPRRIVLGDAPAIAVSPSTAGALAAEEVVVHVPLTARAVEGARDRLGRVLPVVPWTPQPSGWWTEIVAGGDLGAGLGRAATGGGDSVADPVLRVGLGRWPGEPEPGVTWLTDALCGKPTPG